MESEYIAAPDATNEVVWLQKFVIKLGVFPGMRNPVYIYCDDTAAIANAKELRAHSMDKALLRSYHVIRYYVKDGKVKVCKVHMDLNVVDPLMKSLPRTKFDPHQDSLGVRSLPIVN
jgi:hypothetical protein